MKNVSISLTDQHAAEIEAAVASGDYASVSEVVRAALRAYLGSVPGPTAAQIDSDIVDYLADRAAGVPLTDAATSRERVQSQLKG